MITEAQLKQLHALIESGNADTFYSLAPWLRLRKEVLKMDRNECQLCKAKGRYRRAVIVHHVKHLKDRPDLALSVWDGAERQLVSVCRQCHEQLHPESARQYRQEREKPLTEERWD